MIYRRVTPRGHEKELTARKVSGSWYFHAPLPFALPSSSYYYRCYWECYIPFLVFLYVNFYLIFLPKSERPIFSKLRYSIHISTLNQEVGCQYQRYSSPHFLLVRWNALIFLKNQRFLRTPTHSQVDNRVCLPCP